MPLYMYQAAYTPRSLGPRSSKTRRTELKPSAVRRARPSGASSLAAGIALVNMISSSSPMCRTTKVCRQSRLL